MKWTLVRAYASITMVVSVEGGRNREISVLVDKFDTEKIPQNVLDLLGEYMIEAGVK